MSFLAVDIGNTHIKTGLFWKGNLRDTLICSVSDCLEYWPRVEEWLGRERFEEVSTVGIGSVVRNIEVRLSDELARLRADPEWKPPEVSIFTKDFPFPLKSVYQRGQLGTDRVLAAIGAVRLLGKPVTIVDIGSAVTIDVVDEGGVFRGGIISAGAELRIRALAQFTSLLPEVSVPQSPPPLIGTKTEECLSSGVYHGMRAEIQGLVSHLHKALGGKTPVVLSGQGSRLFRHNPPKGWQTDEWLVLKGIYACHLPDRPGREVTR
jgi:type III pantothenate kinase